MREASVESHLQKRVAQLGGVCLKLNPAWHIGVPDRLVLLPGGRAVFVELKRPKGGVIAAHQSTVHGMLRRLGFEVLALRSKEAINERFPK